MRRQAHGHTCILQALCCRHCSLHTCMTKLVGLMRRTCLARARMRLRCLPFSSVDRVNGNSPVSNTKIKTPKDHMSADAVTGWFGSCEPSGPNSISGARNDGAATCRSRTGLVNGKSIQGGITALVDRTQCIAYIKSHTYQTSMQAMSITCAATSPMLLCRFVT